jgi:hypothetical protein
MADPKGMSLREAVGKVMGAQACRPLLGESVGWSWPS